MKTIRFKISLYLAKLTTYRGLEHYFTFVHSKQKMYKYCFAGLAMLLVFGCKPVSDAGASSPVSITAPAKPGLNAGSTTQKTNAFVGEYGDKTPKKGMQVKFGSDGTVTVDGQATTAIGTYSAVGNQAEATFTKTNVARFNHVKFDLSSDGKTLSFLGPIATSVKLQRTL